MSDKEFEKDDLEKNNLEEDQIAKEIDKFYNFVMVGEGNIEYVDRVRFELGGYLREKLDLNDNPVTASLSYLHQHHKEMFENKSQLYRLIKNTLEGIPEIVRKNDKGQYYVARSLRYGRSNRTGKMFDIVLEVQENENYIKHANSKKYNKEMKEVMSADGRDIPLPTYRLAASTLSQEQSLDSGLSSNRSSANIESIIPQKPEISQEILEKTQKFKEALKIFCEQIKMNSFNDKNAQNKRLENLEKRFEILNKHNVFDENTTKKIKEDFQEIKTKIQSNQKEKGK